MAQAHEIVTERRQWQRIPVPLPVFVRGLDAKGDAFQEFTTALNISAGGLAFMLRRCPANDRSPVVVEIPAAPGPQSKGLVRRIEGLLTRVEVIVDWYVCGLQFGQPLLRESHCRPKE